MTNGDSMALCYNDARTRRKSARDIKGRCDSLIYYNIYVRDSSLHLRDYKRSINGRDGFVDEYKSDSSFKTQLGIRDE